MPVMIQALFVGAVFALMACSAAAIESAQRARTTADSPAQPIAMADGLRGYVRNEIYGKGEADRAARWRVCGQQLDGAEDRPLSSERQVIVIDHEGTPAQRCARRDESRRNGDDVAALLRARTTSLGRDMTGRESSRLT